MDERRKENYRAEKRREVRCELNPFHTLLFRYDWRGIWVYCRDCRTEGKRGAEHLIAWRRLLRLFLGLDEGLADNDKHSSGTGIDNNNPKS